MMSFPDFVTALSDFDVNVQWAAIQALRIKGRKHSQN